MTTVAPRPPELEQRPSPPDHGKGEGGGVASRGGGPREVGPVGRTMIRALTALASLRLTVALFAMSIFLVFAGTLAQVESGIWTVLEEYFRTAVAWVEVRSLTFGLVDSDAAFPFPGGWLLGGAILTNLLAAHLMRFKLSWRRCGILMIHTGLIVLVLSEFVTGALAEEGQMSIREGGIGFFVEDIRETEIAVLNRDAPRSDTVVAFDASGYEGARPGREAALSHFALPFDLRVERFMVNSVLLTPAETEAANRATRGDGLELIAEPRPEVAGTSPNQRANQSAAYIDLVDRDTGASMGTYLLALNFALRGRPQVVEHEGVAYHLYLRFKRTYKPYALRLTDFRHDRYIGTDKPKDFASHLRLIDPDRGENREVVIRMNEPLRHRGDSIYQSAFMPDDAGTVLQVVTNPGWTMPYVSCGLITLGLLVQFVMSLSRFLSRGRGR